MDKYLYKLIENLVKSEFMEKELIDKRKAKNNATPPEYFDRYELQQDKSLKNEQHKKRRRN